MTYLPLKRVLSIQSNVSWGYCGNRSATFALQLMGFDVSTIHTVQFSNHTGYGHWRGQVFKDQDMIDLYEGLKQNGFVDEYDFLLTGYAPGKESIEAIATIVKDLKKTNSRIAWLLDPVLGNENGLYVHSNVIPIYKQLISICDIITPNQFEAELLSNQKITSYKTLLTCLTCLHKKYTLRHIVITSIYFDFDKEHLHVIASSCKSDYTPRAVKIIVPFYDYTFSGIGDLFSALFLGQFGDNMKLLPSDEIPATSLPIAYALEKVVSSVQVVVQNTVKSIQRSIHQKDLSKVQIAKLSELCIIQSQDDLKNPNVEFKAVVLT